MEIREQTARGGMVASVQCGTLRTRRPQPRWPLRRQRRSRRILAAAYSCGGLRCTARTRFESISGLVHQWRSLIPCGAISERRSVLPAGMRVTHLNRNSKERYGRRHSQNNRICNPIPHALAAFAESMRGYPVGIGPGWLATNQRAINPIASTTTINTPVRVHMLASLPFTRESRR